MNLPDLFDFLLSDAPEGAKDAAAVAIEHMRARLAKVKVVSYSYTSNGSMVLTFADHTQAMLSGGSGAAPIGPRPVVSMTHMPSNRDKPPAPPVMPIMHSGNSHKGPLQ